MSKKQQREATSMLMRAIEGKDSRVGDKDKLFLTCLPNEGTRFMWLTRYARGLSPTEREYVDAYIKEVESYE